jgi:alpha-L-fucosidase 2
MNLFKTLALASVTLLCASCCTKQDIKIACVGDSITEGFGIDWQSNNSFPSLLDSVLGNGYQVMNFGRSSTTMMETGNFPYWSAKEFHNALEYKADITLIKLGTNDAKLFQWDVDKYKASFQHMIDTFKSVNPKMEIIVCLPAWVAGDRWEITDSVVSNYVVPAAKEVAQTNNLEVIDLYTHLQNKSDLFLKDGIHPNRAGAKAMAEKIASHVK